MYESRKYSWGGLLLLMGTSFLSQAQHDIAPAPLWSFSVGNCTRPAQGGWQGGSGPTSIQTPEPAAYNTGVNYILGTAKFMDVDEMDFSFHYEHRIRGRQSRYALTLFAFKEKLNYDQRHYNNEAPLHLNLGIVMNSRYWVNNSTYRIYGSIAGGAGSIFGAPRMDDDPSKPDPDQPGHYLPYGQVIHHGGYVPVPPFQTDAPRYWMTGFTQTLIGKVNITLGRNLIFYVGVRTTLSEFFQQATTIGTIPRSTKGSLGEEYGLALSFP